VATCPVSRGRHRLARSDRKAPSRLVCPPSTATTPR
jgi:hypothetical protein